MPIERDATLKKAEKLLRQGKLDGAIAEYVRLVEDQPKDWNSINALGDLYVRAGQPEKAAAQFTRVADHLYTEGFLPKAAALYKKVLKIKTDDEHTILQLADLAARQGVLVEAKTYFRRVADQRKARGDQRGAAEMIIRIATLDPGDADSKVAAARAAQSIGDVAKASELLQEAADAFEKQKKQPEALAVLGQALALHPSDTGLRTRLLNGLISQGQVDEARKIAQTTAELAGIVDVLEQQGRNADALAVLADVVARDPANAELRIRLLNGLIAQGRIDEARKAARTAAELLAVADVLQKAGREDQALELMTEAVQLEPANVELRSRLARESVVSGSIERARMFLTIETAGDDPDLLMFLAQMELRAGRLTEGKQALTRLLTVQPERREQLVSAASELADQKMVEAAYTVCEMVADAALLENDWAAAASALHEYVTRVPNQIPALMKLVEICIDGGLESTMYMAQAQLADAYLAAGLGAEARVIAEDLVAREPWERANIDRFRRALMMLGVANPDAVIAERLGGEAPFTSTMGADLPPPSADAAAPRTAPAPVEQEPLTIEDLPPLELTLNAEFGEPVPGAVKAPGQSPSPPAETTFAKPDGLTLESIEIDLSGALEGLGGADQRGPASSAQDLRSTASRQSEMNAAQAQYTAGLDYLKQGQVPEAMSALEAAARVPALRFLAASQLGRLHASRDDLPRAVQWLERAAEAPPPRPEEGFALLYDLADALEKTGESARALAVLLELEADAGKYRDVTSRIDRLSKVQTGG